MEDAEREGACRLADWHSFRAMRDMFVRPERGDSGVRLRLPEGDVVLEEVPGSTYWAATMHWRSGYGSRVLHVGTWRDVMLKALEIQAFGPVGGPDYRPGPLTWVQFDDTERASVPQGELVIVCCSDQALLFHVAPTGAFRFLGVGTREELRATAFYRLGVYRSQPVSVVVGGQQIALRFAGAAGILGLRAGDVVQDAIYLAYLGDGECAVLDMNGVLARLSLHALAGARSGPGPRAHEDGRETASAETAKVSLAAQQEEVPVAQPVDRRSMVDRDEFLTRHLEAVERGCQRGDGKVRARECLALLAEAWRRGAPSFHGTRVQCYRALCEFIGVVPRGSERSIRDAFALIASRTRFVSRDAAGQWWIPFEEVRRPGSELMRWVADHTPQTCDESWLRPASREAQAETAARGAAAPAHAVGVRLRRPVISSAVPQDAAGDVPGVAVEPGESTTAPPAQAPALESSGMALDGFTTPPGAEFRQASPQVFRYLLKEYRPFKPLYGSTLGDMVVARGPPRGG